MPELPEVETTMRGISPYVVGKTVKQIIIRQKKLRWPIPAMLKASLTGQKILSIERRGKYLLLTTAIGTMLLHLGMSGHLRVYTTPTKAGKHAHVDWVFDNDVVLRFTDPRRFGAILWTATDPHQHKLLINLGVEPLTSALSGKYLWQKAKDKTTPIKSFLMDNSIVTGVGNIYANEVLFATGIYPKKPANTLMLSDFTRISKAIKRILKQAIECGGTTLKDFVDSHGHSGYFTIKLKVYGRANQPCYHCATLLESFIIAQRSTVFCPVCQKE